MHPPLSAGGRRGWTSNQIFKKGGWQDLNFKKGDAGKEEVTFFREGGLQIPQKNKLKSEVFNDKKNL